MDELIENLEPKELRFDREEWKQFVWELRKVETKLEDRIKMLTDENSGLLVTIDKLKREIKAQAVALANYMEEYGPRSGS